MARDSGSNTMSLWKLLLFLLLLLIGIGVISIASCPVTWQMVEIRKTTDRMTSPAVYEEAAEKLALLCQSIETEAWTGYMGTAWLPKVIRDLGPSYGNISPDGCRIEMGGGFYHFGYFLARDETTSTAEKNAWMLSFYVEGGSEPLTTVTLGVEQRLSDEEFVRLASTGFDEEIASDPHNIRPYEEQFYFLLKFDQRGRARQLCEDAAKAIPEHWWPRLTMALMDSSGTTTAEAASERFQNWVDANPSLSHYVYLSYFYDAIGNGAAACEATSNTSKQPFTNGEHDINNCWFLTYTATIIAFKHGRYETVIEVTGKILRAGKSRNYVYFDFLGMKAAAHSLLGNHEKAMALLENADPPKPDAEWSRDVPAAIAALKKAIAERNTEAVKAWVRPEAGKFEPYNDLPIEKIRGVASRAESP